MRKEEFFEEAKELARRFQQSNNRNDETFLLAGIRTNDYSEDWVLEADITFYSNVSMQTMVGMIDAFLDAIQESNAAAYAMAMNKRLTEIEKKRRWKIRGRNQ